MTTKTCTKCRIQKSLDNFNKDKRKSDGLNIWCKSCTKIYLKDYYQKTKVRDLEKKNTYNKKYREEHKEEIKQKAVIYRKHTREARKIYSKSYKEKNKSEIKNSILKRHFGITLETYNELAINQNNLCLICNKPEMGIDKRSNKRRLLAVDHDHKTGKVRGLLCSKCNRGLGYFNDNVELLKNSINYLEK